MRIFSGIQPTGEIHIGNYLGAIKQWIELQKNNQCVFCIVDLHALTSDYEPDNLEESILNKAIAYLAAGVDPEKSIIFTQSKISEHIELFWYLNIVTPIGELQRMTQFKEKSEKQKKNANAGLLNYPVLMAADILLYDTEIVPVGEDQKQHVELSRDLAKKFNSRFGETFKIPKALISKESFRIMSLTEPRKKMSKSDEKASYISLFDSPEEIKKKIMGATTDTGKKIKYDPEKKPGVSNLLMIRAGLEDRSVKEIEKEIEEKSYKELKEKTSQIIIDSLEPFRRKQRELESRREVYVQEVLNQGQRRAKILAESKMAEVRRKMGLS